MLTIILTYFEDKQPLEMWLDTAREVESLADDIRFIVIDDASHEMPAYAYMVGDIPNNISLYHVKEDCGYNMYACRNFAMTQTTTQWNAMINIGMLATAKDLVSIRDMIADGTLNDTIIYGFGDCIIDKNNYIITKENFWDAGGYDLEWTGRPGGQYTLIQRLKLACDVVYLDKSLKRVVEAKKIETPLFVTKNFAPRNSHKANVLYVPQEDVTSTIEARIQCRRTSQDPQKDQLSWIQLI